MDIQSIKNKFGIIGTSPAISRSIEMALRVAPTDLSVLITGESGVGKEFFPQIIHQNSARKHSKYIAVNCGAIPEGTIDSELFGHEKGSFTGATESRKGYFEEADGGTIFLDEIAELPLTTQVRLLRVLQSGEFIKVGSSKAQKTDVRVVTATNIMLPQAIEMGRFREDLYYRLNTVPIMVAPLRERRGDIMLLFKKFSLDVASAYRMSSIRITPEAQNLLEKYHWPGNIRQLKNISEQITTIEQGKEITPEVLKRYLPEYNPSTLPILHPNSNSQNRDYSTERDILYKLLFDLRGEVSELRGMMQQIVGGGSVQVQNPPTSPPQSQMPQQMGVTPILPAISNTDIVDTDEFSEVEEVTDADEVMSIKKTKEQVERERVLEALERNGGRRKETADELFMSERTLYRKLKELDIK